MAISTPGTPTVPSIYEHNCVAAVLFSLSDADAITAQPAAPLHVNVPSLSSGFVPLTTVIGSMLLRMITVTRRGCGSGTARVNHLRLQQGCLPTWLPLSLQ
jgi:hypothetical protein